MPGALGYKALSQAYGRSDLPLGIDARGNVKDRIAPASGKGDWSVGMSFNLNPPRTFDYFGPNSGLGLQLKPTPGLMLEGKF